MNIKATERHRFENNVNVLFECDGVMAFDRYVDAAQWDEDPQAIAAQVCLEVQQRPKPKSVRAAINTNPVLMTDAEVAAKINELAALPPK